MKKHLSIFCLFISILTNAQQLPLFSQYLQNDFILNPAVVGSKKYIPITISHRNQWLNFENAPMTQMASIHGGVTSKIGLGFLLINHQTGPTHMVSAQFAYAYHIKLTDSMKLSFGIAPIIAQYALDKSKITLENQNDHTFNLSNSKTLVADLNAGVYLHGKNYFVGLAFPQLMENKLQMGDELFMERLQRHYLLHAGYDYAVNSKYMLSPAVLFKTTKSGAPPAQLDLNVKVTYRTCLWAGLSYRLAVSEKFNDAAVIFLGVRKANFSVGYSYDYSFPSIGNYSVGSHEIVVSYRIHHKSRPDLKLQPEVITQPESLPEPEVAPKNE